MTSSKEQKRDLKLNGQQSIKIHRMSTLCTQRVTRTEEQTNWTRLQQLFSFHKNENQSQKGGLCCSLVGQGGSVFAAEVRVLHRVEAIDGVQRGGHRVMVVETGEHGGRRPTPGQCRLRGAVCEREGSQEGTATSCQFCVIVNSFKHIIKNE